MQINITSLKLEHTNPSLGPYERIITIALTNSKEHQERVQQFLEEAMVNGTVNIQQYITAVLSKDEKVLQKIRENAPKGRLNEGESISNFTISIAGQQSIRFYDVYRRYSLSHFYANFTKYMVEHGVRFEGDKDDIFGKAPKPISTMDDEDRSTRSVDEFPKKDDLEDLR